MRLRLLDLDGSLTGQGIFAQAVASGQAQQVDMRDLGAALRLWTSRRRMRQFMRRLRDLPAPPGDGPLVTFLGSGDYHHLTTALIDQVDEPFSLVHFDNHPDWVRLAPRYHCGSWVNRALELHQVRRVVTAGPCSDDLDRPDLKGGNLGALRDGRLTLLPWQHRATKSWVSPGSGAGHFYAGGRIHWHSLASLSRDAALAAVLTAVPPGDIWLTIDKDVLDPADAATNWDQGGMPLDFLLQAIEALARRNRIIGIDICGEYSSPQFRNWFKRHEARSDHAAYASPPDLARNERTNRLILETLERVAA